MGPDRLVESFSTHLNAKLGDWVFQENIFQGVLDLLGNYKKIIHKYFGLRIFILTHISNRFRTIYKARNSSEASEPSGGVWGMQHLLFPEIRRQATRNNLYQ